MKEGSTWQGFIMGVVAIGFGVVLSEVSRTGMVRMADGISDIHTKASPVTPKKSSPSSPPSIPAPPGNPPPFEQDPETVETMAINYQKEKLKSAQFSDALEQQILEEEGGVQDDRWLEA